MRAVCYIEDEEEEEEEEEDEDPDNTSKSFKEDKCVICLSKKPQVFFVGCRHYCVCLEYEEANPLSKCPKCRKRIKTV